jgi:hypothetical protein
MQTSTLPNLTRVSTGKYVGGFFEGLPKPYRVGMFPGDNKTSYEGMRMLDPATDWRVCELVKEGK